jgi:hypothetical protein
MYVCMYIYIIYIYIYVCIIYVFISYINLLGSIIPYNHQPTGGRSQPLISTELGPPNMCQGVAVQC